MPVQNPQTHSDDEEQDEPEVLSAAAAAAAEAAISMLGGRGPAALSYTDASL
jgi:hypothetical protein